ncbi:MAG: hypothetical protein CL389_09770 [Acidiferrobacteraceae bacterium]|mgnify:CR=1 FL=1|jgi:hypothetical protein|nr:hypothetical protein [Acidiferrobacteraceae bacterium]MDP6791829.1 hypothetical protein [Arenicellales bacterium]MDP6918281.1 hypothetical protein [Arenicellales bacterium]|tara:strand:- start:1507 stop:2001 length:495 start_codon:yes stop_codon:yes gene_type:complete
MKAIKTSIILAATGLLLGGPVIAETVVPTSGHGYGGKTSSTATPLADGSTLIKQTTHEFWIQDPSEANFPAVVVADCNGAMLLSAEGAPVAFSGVCSATDIDGDTFIATNHSMTPDFSDCHWTMYGGTGKYAGVTGSGVCIPGGPTTADGSNTKFSWKGEWVLP